MSKKCIITVRGEKSAQFESLKEKFGQVTAMEVIHSDTSASIEGFVSDVEISDRVNGITFSVLNHLVQSSGGATALDLRPENLQGRHVETALDSAYSDLESIIVDALENYESGVEVEDNAKIARKALVAMKNFDKLEDKVKQRLVGFGLPISDINNDLIEIRKEEEQEETSKEHIYDQKSVETSRLDSVSPQVKLYLASLPSFQFQEDSETGMVKPSAFSDEIGMVKPSAFSDVYSMLNKSLANHATMEDMLDTLGVMANDDPMIRAIYEDLMYSELEASDSPIIRGNAKVKNFENAFFSSFRNNNNQFVTISIGTKKDSETGEEVFQLRTLDSNKRRLNNELKKSWIQANSKVSRLNREDRLEEWVRPDSDGDSMDTFFNSPSIREKLDNKNDTVVLVDLSNYLETTGIRMSVKALSQLRRRKNRAKGSKNFSEYVTTGKESIRSLIMEPFWLNGGDPFKSEDRILSELAMVEAKVSNDRTGGSFMNGEGNQVHPINQPTAASELWDEFTNQDGRFDEFLADPLMSPFKILNDFKRGKQSGMEMRTFDTLFDATRNEGIPYDSLDPTSALATRFNLYLNKNAQGGTGKQGMSWMFIPTPSDRSGSRVVKVKRLKDTSWTTELEEGDFQNWLKDVTNGEFQRITKVRDAFYKAKSKGDFSELVKNFHYKVEDGRTILGNGGYFNYYPTLNAFLVDGPTVDMGDGQTVIQDFDANSPEVWSVLESEVKRQIQADIDYLAEVGLIKPTSTYRDIKTTELAEKLIPKKALKDKSIYSFIANSIMVNHEMSTMFNGDLAHFNGLSDANKRAGLADTPGTKLRVGTNGAKANFRVAYMKDLSFDSDYIDQYEKVMSESLGKEKGKKFAKKYKGVEVTDGQGLVSLDRYAEILAGQGKLTPSMAQTILELKESNPTWSKVTEVLQPVKGFLQGQRYSDKFEQVMPQNLKYSLLPVIPSAIKNNPTMQAIHDKMVESKVDEAVFESASKFGGYNSNSVTQDGPFRTVLMSNEDWRMPQIVPYKTKTKENMGTQLRKLIMGNLNLEGDYNGKEGSQLQADYQAALSGKLKYGFEKLYKELSQDGEISVEKVAERVLNDLSKNAYKSTADFIEQALEVITLEDGSKDTRIPMSFPAIKHRVEGSLNSAVRKATTKQNLPGFVGVQYAAVGFGKESIKTSADLKFVRESNGKILPAEVYMSPQYFVQSLLKMKQTPEIAETVKKLQEGEFDMDMLPDELRNMVIFRIPTQGKNSALPIRVKGFTPKALGSTIVLPAELTTQSGADYDIDKVYVEIKHFDVVDNEITVVKQDLSTEKGRNNVIVDTHYKVLTSPEHFGELITPNNSDTLDALSKDMGKLYSGKTGGRQWSSVATQDDFREKNQAGGVMIGVFSIANTAHSLFQELGVTLKSRFGSDGVKVNGKMLTSLSQVKNQQGGLISDDHIEAQTAAVDNAKNPVLGNLNINTVTANVYNFLVEAGTGIEYAVKMVNSPIIRELTKKVRQNEALMGKDGAFITALKEVSESYNIDTTSVNEKDFDVSLAELDEAIRAYDKGLPIETSGSDVLKAFLTFRKYGQDLVTVQRALQTDNNGASQTLAANVINKEELARVKGTRSNDMYSQEFPADENQVIETIEVNREKYQNHSMEAYEQYGLHGAIAVVSEIIEDSSDTHRKVIKDFQNGIGGKLHEKDVQLLMNDFYTYLFANRENHVEGYTSALADYMESEDLAKLLVGPESVGKRVLGLQKAEIARANDDIFYNPNEFIMSLTVELNDKKTGYDLVNFNNTVSRALSSEQKTTLSNEFSALFQFEETKNLGRDLFLYNFGMEGFNQSTNSFGGYVHTSMYEVITDADGVSLTNYFRSIAPEFDDHNNFSTDDFLLKFLKNRGNELKGLRDLSKRKPAQIKEFLKSNPRVKYFKGKNKIGISVPDMASKYKYIGSMLGQTNVQIEYLSGEAFSDLDMDRISKDIQDNGEC